MSDPRPSDAPRARVALDAGADGGRGVARLSGDLVATGLPDPAARAAARGAAVVDLSAVRRLDTAGAWLALDLAGEGGEIRGASPAQARLLALVRAHRRPAPEAAPRHPSPRRALEGLGSAVLARGAEAARATAFLGRVVVALAGLARRPRALRLTSLVHHMGEAGLAAVPIVALMGFLIGVVLAFQGAVQLRQFGAEIFVVDLIAISVLRELGILLTAIIVAGRSGAAFTASLGSMKMREEVDALRTLGLDPVEVLVLPRILALVIVLPLLGFVASLAGLLGGALMAWIELGVSPALFRSRLAEAVSASHALVGLVKAPVFALIVGVTGCHQGLSVGGDAESLGRMTSASVVAAIFLVIVADAAFSVVFAVIGV